MKNNKQSVPQKTGTQKNIDGIVKSEEITVNSTTTELASKQAETKSTEVETKQKPDKAKKNPKKSGFIGGTLAELKLVEWPTWKYVTGWSLTIILFTALMGSVMGFTDYYFESGIQFIDCTSPNGSKSKSVNDCLKDLTTSLTFQKYFNRPDVTAAQPASDAVTPVQSVSPTITDSNIPIETNNASITSGDATTQINGAPIPASVPTTTNK